MPKSRFVQIAVYDPRTGKNATKKVKDFRTRGWLAVHRGTPDPMEALAAARHRRKPKIPWNVTHRPTGMRLASGVTQADAHRIADAIEKNWCSPVTPFHDLKPGQMPKPDHPDYASLRDAVLSVQPT